MAFRDLDDLNDMHLDVLKEIGNIGSGNAASALSAMLAKPINIAVPKISILDYNTVVDSLGGPENLLVSLLFTMTDDVQGMMIFLLQKDFAHMLLNTLLGCELNSFSDMGEMELSALKEVGNIMAASYVNAISTLADLRMNISVPDICIDMAGSILSVPAIHYANISDKIIFINDEFNAEGQNASSQVLMIPDMESLEKIMKNLGLDQ
ncbi:MULTISPECIES: chemotaxis protein CheC [Caproicibacterium]|uniref:Chemotaxis protein CheC n=1 Tax=Caproicibacterium argilliputei TaxID=3030016 RepID=A0AA97D9E1_9FIRM|nr:chemotaxis protein CheC [Caproicibacterium argilliputei]WOC31251.1 chemotaxis protein CheC [Caproicibacterium argilliputei]